MQNPLACICHFKPVGSFGGFLGFCHVLAPYNPDLLGFKIIPVYSGDYVQIPNVHYAIFVLTKLNLIGFDVFFLAIEYVHHSIKVWIFGLFVKTWVSKLVFFARVKVVDFFFDNPLTLDEVFAALVYVIILTGRIWKSIENANPADADITAWRTIILDSNL
jgi:hypothetical protein